MRFFILPILFFAFTSSSFAQTMNFFDFRVKNNAGDSIDLSIYKGKKIMVVNTASACGYTTQYGDLQKLYEDYQSKGFVVIVFPSPDFNQEPLDDDDILDFCQTNYGVTFPIMAKSKVTGPDAIPVFKWLTQKSQNAVKDVTIGWNFYKFMINEDGSFYDYMTTSGSPSAPKVLLWLDNASEIPKQLVLLDAFTLYPSPATTEFNIHLSLQSPAMIKLNLVSSTGMLIDNLFDGMLEKDLTTSYFTDRLKSGLYIIMLEIDGYKHIRQFWINK